MAVALGRVFVVCSMYLELRDVQQMTVFLALIDVPSTPCTNKAPVAHVRSFISSKV